MSLNMSKRPYFFIFFFSVLCFILYYTRLQKGSLCQSDPLDIKNGASFEYSLKKTPPVVVQPDGRLGNHLFQYAAAYSLAKQRNSDLFICLPSNWERKYENTLLPFHITDRLHSINVSNVPHHNILVGDGGCSLTKISNCEIFYPQEEDIIKEKLPRDKILYLKKTYLESEIFFKAYKEDIINLITSQYIIENRESAHALASKITTTESVAIHIRRGDFASAGRILPISYYDDAIKLINKKITEIYSEKKNVTFFVFSDDIKSVISDFKNLSENFDNFVFVSNGTLSREDDLILMSLCKHNIIANSTFSWWAAYLNRNKGKIVVAPSPKFKPEWYKRDAIKDRTLLIQIYGGVWTYPYDWLTINPY